MVVARAPSTAPKSAPPPLPLRAKGAPRSTAAQPITRRLIEASALVEARNVVALANAEALAAEVARGPIAATFERLHALDYFDDALEGASFCLDVLAAMFPARTFLVHLFDVERKEFVVVDARGEAADSLKLTRCNHTDLLLRLSMRKAAPVAWRKLDRAAPQEVLARFAELPGARTVIVAPLLSGPRWLGAIELVDPVDDTLSVEHESAIRHVAERYARFLHERGVIVDTVTVARFAFRA